MNRTIQLPIEAKDCPSYWVNFVQSLDGKPVKSKILQTLADTGYQNVTLDRFTLVFETEADMVKFILRYY